MVGILRAHEDRPSPDDAEAGPGSESDPWGSGSATHGGSQPTKAHRRRTTGDAGSWLVIAAVGFIGGQILSVVILSVVAAANGHSSDWASLAAEAVPPAWIVVGGLVGLWIGFLGAVGAASRWRGTGDVVADMGLKFRPWDPVIGGVIGVLGQFVLLPLLYYPWEHVDPKLSHELQAPAKHLTGGFPGIDLAVIAVLTVLVVPVVEELFFRGLVLKGFLRLFRGAGRILGPALAVVTTGIVFGAGPRGAPRAPRSGRLRDRPLGDGLPVRAARSEHLRPRHLQPGRHPGHRLPDRGGGPLPLTLPTAGDPAGAAPLGPGSR